MRIPNLNVSDSITRTIRDLDAQRLKLDKQISTGQKNLIARRRWFADGACYPT